MGYVGLYRVVPEVRHLAVRLRHYEGLEDVSWHVQVEVAALSDPQFAAPVLSLDSSLDQADWLYRVDEHGADGALLALPAEGVPTHLEGARSDGRAATVFKVLSQDERRALRRGRTYWQRSRQSADGGATWGDWLVEPLEVV